tara:strand:- start:349 stop:1716 length:1368 start_codon:yes stop_codon:yes gene_type:complete
VGNLLPKVGSLFLLPIIANHLGADEYGIVQSLTVLQSILIVFFTFGLERSIFRLFFDYNNESAQKRFFGTLFYSILIIGLAFVSLLFLFNTLVGSIYNSIDFYPYFAYMILSVYFSSIGVCYTSYLQVRKKARSHLTLAILKFSLNYALVLFFVIVMGRGAEGMLLGILLTHLLFSPFYFWRTTQISRTSLDLGILKSTMAFSWPFVPSLVFAWVLNFSDRVLIERFLGTTDVGVYSIAYQLAMLITILYQAVLKAYSPYYFGLAKNKDENYSKILNSNNALANGGIYISILFLLGVPLVFDLLFKPEYHEAIGLLPILVLGNLLLVFLGLKKLGLYQNKKSFQTMIAVILSGIINVAFNLFLIPKYGMLGAAYSTFVAVLANYLMISYLSKREFDVPFGSNVLLNLFLALLTYFGFNYVKAFLSNDYRLVVQVFLICAWLAYGFFAMRKVRLSL